MGIHDICREKNSLGCGIREQPHCRSNRAISRNGQASAVHRYRMIFDIFMFFRGRCCHCPYLAHFFPFLKRSSPPPLDWHHCLPSNLKYIHLYYIFYSYLMFCVRIIHNRHPGWQATPTSFPPTRNAHKSCFDQINVNVEILYCLQKKKKRGNGMRRTNIRIHSCIIICMVPPFTTSPMSFHIMMLVDIFILHHSL